MFGEYKQVPNRIAPSGFVEHLRNHLRKLYIFPRSWQLFIFMLIKLSFITIITLVCEVLKLVNSLINVRKSVVIEERCSGYGKCENNCRD